MLGRGAGGVALCIKNGTMPISGLDLIGALRLAAVLNVRIFRLCRITFFLNPVPSPLTTFVSSAIVHIICQLVFVTSFQNV
jgi:uncharacterized protein (DUF2062 family)